VLVLEIDRFEKKISLEQTEVWTAYGASEVGCGRESTKGFLGIRKNGRRAVESGEDEEVSSELRDDEPRLQRLLCQAVTHLWKSLRCTELLEGKPCEERDSIRRIECRASFHSM
jgi:hypothetical protein